VTQIDLPLNISYSQVNTYLTCSEKYRLEKVVRAPKIPMWAGVGGSAVHAVTEARDRLRFSQEPGGPTDFQEAFDLAIAEEVERSGFPTEEWTVTGRASKEWPDKETEAWWRAKGPSFCDSWDRWQDQAPWQIWVTPEGVPAIELELHPIFGGMPDVLYIDRVMVTNDGELVVVDIKTGSRVPDGTEQLGDYAAGMEQLIGIRPTYGTFWMARKGYNTPSVDLDHHTQAAVDYRYRTARAGMEAGIFIAHPSSLCGSCPVRDACYAMKGKNAHLYTPWS
jgi:putative RecB family exonuclease